MSRIAKLPAGYRQVEYIESSGTQHVDTEFKPNQDSSIIMDVAFNTTATQAAYGARTSASSKAFTLIWMTNGYYRFYYNNGYSNFTNGITDSTVRHTIKQEKNVLTIGDAIFSRTYAAFQCDYNLYLFAHNAAGAVSHPASAKIYSCQIYDNGTLVRDYIPCINPSGEAGLYDLVYGVFYGNAGNGVFAVGRKVYSESEVTKLEYIQSNGTQKINTEIYVTNASVVKLSFTPSSQYNAVIFGAAWANFCFLSWANNFFWMSGGVDYSSPNTLSTTDVNEVECGYNYCIVNGVRHNTGANGSNVANVPINIFDTYEATGYPATMKLYAFQSYIGNEIERDYYPAEINGEVGLWDAVSGALYTDPAGATFIAGPEIITIAPPKNLAAVVTEAGVVLTWDAEEKAIGYKVYRDETNLAYTAETSYTDGTAMPNNNYIYGVSAYNADTETATTEITVFVEAPYSPLELITDRTHKALERVIELAGKDYMTEMSEEEQEEWRNGMKGTYNASDLNRVGKAVDALAKLLRELVPELKSYAAQNQIGWDAFYAPPFDPSKMYPSTKRDWTVRDIPSPADMERYLSNIKLLRNALVYNTDALPASMENLTWSGANAIEKALFALDGAIILFNADIRLMIDKAVATMFYCNEIYSGEV